MDELAARLGVDRSTVSRALSRDKSYMVNADTRERIQTEAARVGYRPDLNAAALRTGRSNTIGVLIPNLLNETFISVTRQIVVDFAAYSDKLITPLIGETRDSPVATRDLVDTFLSRRVDAIISLSAGEDDTESLLNAARQVPVVLAMRRLSSIRLPMAICDDHAGGALVAAHFFARGHRLVGQIQGPTRSATFADRARGFSEMCRQHGLTEVGTVSVENATIAEGRRAVEEFLQMTPRPTAIFAHNDPLALGVLESIRAHGMACPADMAVAGYNNTHVSQLLATPLTTVDYPILEVSRHAGLLTRALIADPAAKLESRSFKPALIERQSS